jgi:glycosyltransferase involved in cell wall biosynthesis
MSTARIAVVATSDDVPGGQGVQARALVERLRDERFRVEFIPIDPRPPRGLRWIRGVPYLRTAVNELLYLGQLARLRRAEVAHLFSAAFWSFLLAPAPAILLARALGLRVVLVYHSGEADEHLRRWSRRLAPWLARVDEIVVPSEYLRQVFARHGYAATVIPNVIDTSRFVYRVRDPLRPRLLSTRNLEPMYDVENTIRAFALLRRRVPQAELTVAGQGSERARLERLAAPIGGVRFTGAVPAPDMPALYDRGDIFVNSSLVDNQPVSVLEAFAAGLPVVSTPSGGLSFMVREGRTGRVVPPRDPQAMAGAVLELLEHPDRARDLAGRAREEVASHTWENVRERWQAVSRSEPRRRSR